MNIFRAPPRQGGTPYLLQRGGTGNGCGEPARNLVDFRFFFRYNSAWASTVRNNRKRAPAMPRSYG